jgi:demethylmenaquinone methyltransferase/2-methoxy-6-polyprenyl-1,4-benzoquinol methylase
MTTTVTESSPRPRTQGASPEGAANPQAAAQAVRQMFSDIAPRYDLLNHVLSMNVDRFWWWRTAKKFDAILSDPTARVLDLCCGTGDMAFALQRRTQAGARIVGADFAHPMLHRAALKSSAMKSSVMSRRPAWIEADALQLPFADASFSLVTSAFGFRNLANYDDGLKEILRVLRPGGECGILECGEPEGALGAAYRLYFHHVLPKIGTALSGVRGPYDYLPNSVGRFPKPPEMLDRMRAGGFSEAQWTPYTFGIAALYWGKK